MTQLLTLIIIFFFSGVAEIATFHELVFPLSNNLKQKCTLYSMVEYNEQIQILHLSKLTLSVKSRNILIARR